MQQWKKAWVACGIICEGVQSEAGLSSAMTRHREKMRSRNAGRKELPEDDEDAGMLIQGIAVFLDPDTTLNPSAIGAKLPPEEMEEEMTVPDQRIEDPIIPPLQQFQALMIVAIQLHSQIVLLGSNDVKIALSKVLAVSELYGSFSAPQMPPDESIGAE